MKKSYNPMSDVRNENVEGGRRLFRVISDVVRHLDERRGRAKTCGDLFAPSLEAQRLKLRDSCEKLMFLDPVGYGQKGEELLWRKGYYDVVTTAKRLRKNNAWSPVEAAYMQNHLSAGVGHYHHLVFRLQIEFKLDLRGVIDFPLLVNDDGLIKGKTSTRKSTDPACVKWAREALHRCLVYLGDLSRYFLDLHPRWDTGLPLRYYLQALNMNSEIGMPHNQLGTLSGSQNYCIDAAYHYMRCLICPEPFEGAEGNLQRIFNKNAKWLEINCSNNYMEDSSENVVPTERIHCFISRFLLLIDVWFFDKTSVSNLHELCHQTLLDFQLCLGFAKPFPGDTNSKGEQLDLDDLSLLQSNEENEKPEYLKDEVVFKMVVMLLLCVSKLQGKSSQQISAVIAFTLAVFSQLVQQVILHIQDSVFNMSLNSPPAIKSISPVMNNCKSDPSIPDTAYEGRLKSSKSENGKEEHLNGFTNSAVCNGNGVKSKKNERKTNLLKKLRRRRRRRRKSITTISSEDSDYSDGDFPYGASSSSDDGNSDLSEIEEPCIICSDVDDDVDDDDSDDSETSSSLQIEPKKLGSQSNIITCSAENLKPDEVAKNVTNYNGEDESRAVLNGGLDAGTSLSSLHEPSFSDKPLDPADVIELVAEEGLLDVIKICSDWLRGDGNIIKACGQSSRTLLSRVINLLNLINVDANILLKQNENAKFYKLKNIQDVFQKVPMPEDIELKGLLLLKTTHDSLDWEYLRHHCLHFKEEALLRIYKLIDFGHFLATMEETGVAYDETSRLFSVKPNSKEENGVSSPEVKVDESITETNGKVVIVGGVPVRADPLQKHMGELWLRAEVNTLESRRSRRPRFSPYLAVDAEALTYHLHLIKQLAGARKFIILVPHVVMAYFDSKKNEVGRVRESIRWLDTQFRHGNRFLRAQRPHERLRLPLIKYPKKKEEAAWLFFNMVECCYYFSQSSTSLHDLQINVPVVTLLTGQRPAKDDTNKTFSPLGVAKSAGINLEHIEIFHAKWKTSSKSHG